MANNVDNNVTYYLSIDSNNKSFLNSIRHWQNLMLAYDLAIIWVKDFSYAQLESLEVKSIPFKTIYYAKDGKLYLLNSLLPNNIIPSLLWSPINRALPIQLPSFNHNYFGINEQIDIKLVATEIEKNPFAIIVTLSDVEKYIYKAAAIRLQKIKWCILNNNKVLLIGLPLLPIRGLAYWQSNSSLLPLGFDFELFILINFYNNLLNSDNENWIIWNTDGSYFLVEKATLQNLSNSSFKLTIQNISVPQF